MGQREDKLKPLFVTSKDGTKIAYETSGQGPRVILVLGALNSRKSGASLAKILASRFAVISYDRRGRGDSTDTVPYSPEREVEDLNALIEALGGSVFLYGHSSGAALALHTVVKEPKKVRKLAIYEAPYSMDEAGRKAAEEYSTALKKVLVSRRNGDAVALFIRLVGVSEKQVQAMKRMPLWRGLEKLAPTLAYDSQIMGPGNALPTFLGRVSTPTLVMHGGAGASAMRDAAQAISKTIPNAQLRTLAGETHGVKPKSLAPVLQEFFQ